MVGIRAQTLITIALSGILAMVSMTNGDWMWFVIAVLGIVALAIPYILDQGYQYGRGVVRIAMVAPVAGIALTIVVLPLLGGPWGQSDMVVYTYLTYVVRTYHCFIVGLMVALIMDRSLGMTMTVGWIVVFAVIFTMSMAAMDMFLSFMELYSRGSPVFNDDFADHDIYTNADIMTSPLVSALVTPFLAAVILLTVRGLGGPGFIVDSAVDA